MKKQIKFSALIFLAGLLTSSAAFAQRGHGPGDGRGGGGGRNDRGRWETTTVYLLYSGRDFMLSVDPNEAAHLGYRADHRGTLDLFRNDDRGYRVPLYRCIQIYTGKHFASTQVNCEGHRTEFLLGFMEIAQDRHFAPTQVFRCHGKAGHLITPYVEQCNRLGYRLEGGMGFIR